MKTTRDIYTWFAELDIGRGMKITWRRVIMFVIVALIVAHCLVVWIEFCKSENTIDIIRRQHDARSTKRGIWTSKMMAIVVPIHQGDKDRAMESLQRWPSKCHPLTTQNVDLIVYEAENETDEVELLARVANGPAKCFRKTSVVSGNLLPEENIYPKGASVQFYKMFLDPSVRKHLVMYDALAVIEWDVVVVHYSSFERLYEAAFKTSEPFWVKGSTLSGNEFLETASMPEQWHILGHLNGNAIYNNSDPAFIEFVNFTLNRWGFTYSYDVALWATISDFPYSWPLWQRYASKFVATTLISNVGFHDVSNQDVYRALTVDTMFIHGSTKSLGSISNSVARPTEDHTGFLGCSPACGFDYEVGRSLGVYTFCDPKTCSSRDLQAGSIFERLGCGAGDPKKFGPACRFCIYENLETLNEKRKRLRQNLSSVMSDVPPPVCPSKMTSESDSCTQQCIDDHDTICDYRCGDGLYGDFNCNWRGLGKYCRFCFHDVFAAGIADKVANTTGGRVLMCKTQEPPPLGVDMQGTNQSGLSVGTGRSLLAYLGAIGVHRELSDKLDPFATESVSNITLGQLCVFIPGDAKLHHIIEVSVLSIRVFMPGARVVVATNSANFDSYNSTFAQTPGVSIATFPRVQFAALQADEACGSETQFILYMTPGELLSRTFTPKDTHSPTGDLLVMYTDVGKVSEAHAKRALASALILGFHSPSFTFGTDLILPVEANKRLRAKLITRGLQQSDLGEERKGGISYSQIIESILKLIPTERKGDVSIYIPEVLAAITFLHNLDGIRFVNLRDWNVVHLFREISIWDVPLVKPRFGCIINTSHFPENRTADELRKWVAAFIRGARCERGFIGYTPSP